MLHLLLCHNSSSNTDEDEEKIEDSYEFGQAPTASPALDLHPKDDEMSVSDMASSNDEAGEDGEIQIVLEGIEVPTMEPNLQSPNKTRWLSEGTERFIKLAKGYGGRMCNVCHYEFPNRGKLLEHVSQHKASYICASRADSFWRYSIRNHKKGHGGDEHQITYAVDAKIFGMCRENF